MNHFEAIFNELSSLKARRKLKIELGSKEIEVIGPAIITETIKIIFEKLTIAFTEVRAILEELRRRRLIYEVREVK